MKNIRSKKLSIQKLSTKKILSCIILMGITAQLTSCAVIFAGAGAATANTFASRRGIKGVWSDYAKRYDITENWKKAGLTELRCIVSGDTVMIYGPKPKEITQYIKIARETQGVETVLDKTHEGIEKGDETNDAMLQLKIKTILSLNFKVQSRNYQIQVYNSTVYILGSAFSDEERAKVLKLISEIAGIKHVEHSIEIVEAPSSLLMPKI